MLARFAPPVARRPDRPPLSWRLRERWRGWIAARRVGDGSSDPYGTSLGAEALHPMLATIRGSRSGPDDGGEPRG